MSSAAAGPEAAGRRGDCRVAVRPLAPDTPPITVTSKVMALYGAAIERQARDTLRRLDADDLAVAIDDSGALPFVIAARIEAAVRRLRPDTAAAALPPPVPQTPRRAALRRSRLYLPGNTPRFFVNAGLYRPDAVILDLEDGVPPAEKDAALVLVRNALRAVDWRGAERMVRVNALPAGLAEIRALAPHGVDTFLLPKAEDAAAVADAAAALDRLALPDVALVPIVESARGVAQAFAIAAASPRVAALAIGLEDYTADIGAERTAAGRESLWAQSRIVNAARAAGVQPLASVYSALDDAAGLQAWLRDARGLGFTGAGCVHPRQIAAVHAAFAPTAAERAAAERIVAAFEAALAAGEAVAAVDGRMVDAPVAERARRLLSMVNEEAA